VKTRSEVDAIIQQVEFRDGWFVVHEKGDGWLVQLCYFDKDVHTGEREIQHCRKFYVSPHMTETEVVETAWAACQRSMMHRAGEYFTYRGKRVYSPHFSIGDRLEMAARPEDARPAPPAKRECSCEAGLDHYNRWDPHCANHGICECTGGVHVPAGLEPAVVTGTFEI
jgi:hypothetical protein